MLKPRKQKRLQTVKITQPRSSRAIAANAYIGKKLVYKVEWQVMVKVARHLKEMIEARDQDKGDYFQQKKIYRDLYRLNQLEWLLSWVYGRDTLYMLRKFPRPVQRSTENQLQFMQRIFDNFASKDKPIATGNPIVGHQLKDGVLPRNFSHIGINANRPQQSAGERAAQIIRQLTDGDDNPGLFYPVPTALMNPENVDKLPPEIFGDDLKLENGRLVYISTAGGEAFSERLAKLLGDRDVEEAYATPTLPKLRDIAPDDVERIREIVARYNFDILTPESLAKRRSPEEVEEMMIQVHSNDRSYLNKVPKDGVLHWGRRHVYDKTIDPDARLRIVKGRVEGEAEFNFSTKSPFDALFEDHKEDGEDA
ncbi:hypothetical protein pEaSNUABM29_00016 [Erwinia phage pEa_SNUABM_29]|nr:hypothetical protein pEaSNUABM29_00016 [Erwinia phage pEa_SNUABM_29]